MPESGYNIRGLEGTISTEFRKVQTTRTVFGV